MPKVTKAHLEAREQQILLAAHKCFSEKGFQGTTMRDICREAKLSPGAVYRYFKGKDAIVEGLARCGRTQTRAWLEEAGGSGDARDALVSLATTVLGWLDSPEARQSIRMDVRMWGEAIHTAKLRKLFQQGSDTVVGLFAETIRRGQKAGEIRRDLPAGEGARLLLAMLQGLIVEAAVLPRADRTGLPKAIGAFVRGAFAAGRRSS